MNLARVSKYPPKRPRPCDPQPGILDSGRVQGPLRLTRFLAVVAIVLGLSVANAATATNSPPLPRDLEMELAASALPAALRAEASVYVLDASTGYLPARRGTNGFHAYVKRVETSAFAGDWDFDAFPPNVLVPVAYDEAGAEAIMVVDFEVAAMRARGVSAREVKNTVNERYENGAYRAPPRAGVSYMLSPILHTYLAPDKSAELMTTSYPHYMFYAPNVSNDAIHGDPTGSHPYIISEGPHGFLIVKAGAEESEMILDESAKMLAELCHLNQAWCLPD